MPDFAVGVEGLGKRYFVGSPQGSYRTLREDLTDALLSPFRRRREKPASRSASRELWALRDVSFEVPAGEVLGVIGRNGAGKSTLLKILSRITPPTEGRGLIRGRVGSLLEVGTGFHPELTGRENAYLSGVILGMRRAEVRKRFDEIVAFAEVERFIDTPVKRYSSGMYLRLAFAVAAHLEPEILLVDEVLAVGDAAFQKKCLGKMSDVARGGRTILFVSHGMDAVRRLCSRCIWLDGGRVREDGRATDVVSAYLFSGVVEGADVVFAPPRPLLNGLPVRLHRVRVTDEGGTSRVRFSRAEAVRVEIEWESTAAVYKPRIGFVLLSGDGTEVLTSLDATCWAEEALSPGVYRSSCALPGRLLNEGTYFLDVGGDSPRGPSGAPCPFPAGRTGGILRFEVEDPGTLESKYYGEEGFRDSRWPGVVLPEMEWRRDSIALRADGSSPPPGTRASAPDS